MAERAAALKGTAVDINDLLQQQSAHHLSTTAPRCTALHCLVRASTLHCTVFSRGTTPRFDGLVSPPLSVCLSVCSCAVLCCASLSCRRSGNDWRLVPEFQRVLVTGSWDYGGQVKVGLRGAPLSGTALSGQGYYCITPLRLATSGHTLLVNRGWVERKNENSIPRETEAAYEAITHHPEKVSGCRLCTALHCTALLRSAPHTVISALTHALSSAMCRRLLLPLLPDAVLHQQLRS